MHDIPGIQKFPSKEPHEVLVTLLVEPSRNTVWETCWEFVVSHEMTDMEQSAFWHGANLIHEAMRDAADR